MPTANYTTTISQIKTTKGRLDRLQEQLAKESQRYDDLILALQQHLAAHLGQNITILPEGITSTKPRIQEVIIGRIKQLRSQNKAYDEIANRLNVEGFRAEGHNFNGVIIRTMFEGTDA